MRCDKTWVLSGLAALVVAAPVLLRAQTDFAIGSIIKSFQLPQRDAEGNMKLQIFGDQATVITPNRIKIEKLRIEVYKAGQPEIEMRSPECDYWKLESRLTSSKGVEVQHSSFKLKADKMDWELNGNKGLFQGGVQLTVQKKEAITSP